MVKQALIMTTHRTYLPFVRTPSPPRGAVQVVYVSSPNEPMDTAYARQQVERGLAYWNELLPVSPGLHIAKERTIQRTDPFSRYSWTGTYSLRGYLTAVVIANQHSRAFVNLGGNYLAPAWDWPDGRAFFSTTHTKPPYGDRDLADFLGMAVAHEVGHCAFGLPDRFGEHDVNGISIMKFPDLAYQAWTMHPADVVTAPSLARVCSCEGVGALKYQL
jgi:hypothetical protein